MISSIYTNISTNLSNFTDETVHVIKVTMEKTNEIAGKFLVGFITVGFGAMFFVVSSHRILPGYSFDPALFWNTVFTTGFYGGIVGGFAHALDIHVFD